MTTCLNKLSWFSNVFRWKKFNTKNWPFKKRSSMEAFKDSILIVRWINYLMVTMSIKIQGMALSLQQHFQHFPSSFISSNTFCQLGKHHGEWECWIHRKSSLHSSSYCHRLWSLVSRLFHWDSIYFSLGEEQLFSYWPNLITVINF